MDSRAMPAGFEELRGNRLLCGLSAAYALLWAVTAIRPYYRQDWWLENLLVFAAVPVLVILYRRRLLSNRSYVMLFVFLSLHAVGAHFTYTEMPLGSWLRDNLHWQRNHYDRLVHFAFGLLVASPVQEVLGRLGLHSRRLSAVVAVHVVLAWSGCYEVMEGLVAHLVNPELGAAFNGIQGDIWDSQKDMSLALSGAVASVLMAAGLAGKTAESEQ